MPDKSGHCAHKVAAQPACGLLAFVVPKGSSELVTAGVRVFFYLEDRERTFDTHDKLLLSLTAFADEFEREKARQRTYDAIVRKARAGHVTGGRMFGYDNLGL